MFTRFFLSVALVLTHCTPLYAQSMKFSRPDIMVSQDSKVNYVKNPSGYKNAQDITVSSATIAQDVSGSSDFLDGVASLICDASSQNGYCEWDSNAIQEGDKTGNCEAKALFKGDASLYKLQIHDGSNVLASSSVLSNATDWTEVSINYPCGATRKVRLTQTESGTGAAVNIGRVYWGQATNLGVANQDSAWTVYTPTSSWVSGATIYGLWRRDGPDMEVQAAVFVTAGVTAANLTISLPTGHTIDTSKITSNSGTANKLGIGTALDSGVQNYDLGVWYSSTTAVAVNVANTSSTYSSGAFVTNAVPFTFGSPDELNINFKVPIVGWGAQSVVNDNITPWYIDATMDGDSFDLGTSNQTAYIETTASAITLKPQSGSQPVGVMCSGTNAAVSPSTSNTVCPSSNESAGINFSIPKSGAYEVCVYGNLTQTADSGEELNTTLQLIETPTNAQTLTLEGGTRQFYRNIPTTIASGVDASIGHPISNCSIFNWSSNGTKGVRLMYEQAVAGTPDASNIIADASANNGQRNLRWTVKPVTASSPTPLLVGSVTSNSSGLERIERARLNCDSGSAITSQSGSWVSSIGNISTGVCTVTIASGIFSSTPTCVMTEVADVATTTVGAQIVVSSATSFTITGAINIGGTTTTQSAFDAYVICMGSR